MFALVSLQLQVVLFTVFASVTTVYGSKENNTYIIIAPKVFRPGMDMVLRVSILKSASPVDVKASIRNELTKEEVATGQGTYEAGKPGNLGIKVPFSNVVKQASYALSVNSTGGLQFSEKSYIQFREKGFSIYIQTDKGIYKPGQTVHMRILAVYPDLKPYSGKVTVNMLDPNGNKMQHWADLKGPAGVIEKDFTLSSDPVYGNWKISVLAEGQKKEQTIEIKEYVLPRFKVSVELPPFVIEGAKEIKGKVISKYTYGKGVKGFATVRAFFAVYNPKKKMEVTKRIKVVDGTGSFTFSVEHINKIFKSSWSWYKTVFDASWVKLTVNATVEDELTSKEASAENQVSFYKTDVKLSFPKINPATFKPGLKYIGVLAVTKPDDTPLPPDRLQSLKIYVQTNFKYGSKGTTEEYSPSAEGLITLTKEIPKNADTISFKASTDETLKDYVYHSAQKAVSPSSSYIQLSTGSSSYEAGAYVECKLRATFVLTGVKLTYMVMARGNIVLNKVESLSTSTKEASFKFKASHSMAPSARLVVYIIQKDGEVVVDSLNLRVDKPFENEVSLSYSRKESRPGDQVILKTKATPGSYVGILAVDESVLLMKKNNDFSHKKVIEELQSYDSAHQIFPWFFDWGPRRRRRMIMPFPTSGEDAASVFENSGVVVLSDCNVYRQSYRWTALGGGDRGLFAFAEAGGDTLLRAKSGGGQPRLKEVTRVRTLFPETWIWRNATADSDGEADLVAPVPDTITSWVASAFALHPKAGFGVAPLKPKLKVFQPFFVSLDLPYSVIRGEQVAIKVLVFNYLDEAMEVKVTLKKSANWHIISELSNGVEDKNEISPDVEKMVTVPAGAGEAVSFPIIPKILGDVPVVVQAQSTKASDAVRRNLLVEAEGIPQEYSYSLLIDLNSTNQMRRELELALPPSAVEGSARAKVTIIGDILGSSISNLDDLLRMPYGCGEQNMVNFAPNIFVMKYLSTVNQLTAYIKNKAENYMKSGYQREQTYRHKEGSYSAFGERDDTGSLWLTAFVVKSFAQARDYIYVDPDSLQLSLNWIVRQQKTDGSFPRVGKVHSSALKGGLKGEVALTAYVLITLVEAKSSDKKVTDAIKNSISYIEGTLKRTLKEEDPYTLAIVYYALSLEKRTSRHDVKQKLLALAERQDGTVHWAEKKVTTKKSWWSPYYKPPSADIEITAYVLLALTSDKDMKLGLEVVRWLSQQRNSLGGYSSTQDTVVGIQALAEFATLVYSPKVDFNVNIKTKQLDRTVSVDGNNVMVLQVIDLPKVEGVLKIDATGHGVGMLQVGVTYHVNSTSEKPSFDFRFKIVTDELDKLETEACAKWTGESDTSDMAVMEVGIISGFSLDSEQARELMSNKELSLKRVDTRGRKVMLYFDEIRKSRETCVKLKFDRSHAVGKAQPVPAVLYDYYHPDKRSTALYTSEKLASEGVCSVCPTCVNCGNQTGPSPKPRSSSSGLRGSWLTHALAWIIITMAVAQRLN